MRTRPTKWERVETGGETGERNLEKQPSAIMVRGAKREVVRSPVGERDG